MSVQRYRVRMKDGYAGVYNATGEDEAKSRAVEYAKKSTEGAAMSPRERRDAVTVDYVKNLSAHEE